MLPITSIVLLCLSTSVTYVAAQATSCTGNAPASPKPTPYLCGAPGSVSNPQTLQTFTTDADDCQNSCLSAYNCMSFSFDASSGACGQYTKAVKKMGFTRAKTGVNFYNRNCFTTCLATFILELSNSGTQYDDTYVRSGSNDGSIPTFENTMESADVYSLDDQAQIVRNQSDNLQYWYIDPSTDTQNVMIGSMGYIDNNGYTPLTCSFTPKDLLTCSAQADDGTTLDVFEIGGFALKIGPSPKTAPFKLHVLPPP